MISPSSPKISLDKKHQLKVEAIAEAVRTKPEGKHISIRKNTPHHQIHNLAWKDKCHRIDVSALNEILAIQTNEADMILDRDGVAQRVAWCEGQVQMGQLAEATLPLGYVACVVPEFNNFTVAGLINGEGIQTSGHRYGLFTSNILAIEVVLGNGEVRIVTPTDPETKELFINVIESYGSMGIVTMAAVALRPCKPYVVSRFEHFTTCAAFTAEIDHCTRSGLGDFLEGLVLGPDSYLVVKSEFASERGNHFYLEPGPKNRKGDMWYYQHVMERVVQQNKKKSVYWERVMQQKEKPVRLSFFNKASTKEPTTTDHHSSLPSSDGPFVAIPSDVMPVYDFLFRSMRGGWWMIDCHVNIPFVTHNNFMRRIIDVKAVEQTDKNGGFKAEGLTLEETMRCIVLQDMGIQLRRLQEGIEWVNARLGVYPLWICPVHVRHLDRLPEHRGGHVDPTDPEARLICDIGIYGEPTVRPFYHRKVLKELADFVDYPSTWGLSYESREVIKARKDPLRIKYHAIDAFVGIEDKVTYRSPNDLLADKETSIWMWRWRRDYGPYWPIKLFLFVSLILLLLCGLLWGAWWMLSSR